MSRATRRRSRRAAPSSDGCLGTSLAQNEDALRSVFGGSFDITFRSLQPGPDGRRLLLVYLRGAVDERLLARDVLGQLSMPGFPAEAPPGKLVSALKESFVAVGTVREIHTIQEVVRGVLNANVVLLVDGASAALEAVSQAWPTSGLEEAETEPGIRGPRQGFGETILDNTAVLRKIIRHPSLRFEKHVLGRLTNTGTIVAYIADLAPQSLIDEVNRRLDHILTDAVLESGYIEEFIRDHPWSPFPMVMRTERPDRVAASLLEGRVAIMVDGTPFVLVVPVTLAAFLTAADDWYEGFVAGTFIRLLRYVAFAVSLLFPALYVAITTYHQEMIPTSLALSIANQRHGIPFPALAEALILQLLFEMLRKAGIRLPKVIGPAITIVGALIIGQQAVEAGLVSPFMIIIIATTTIASFMTPVYSITYAVRLIAPLLTILGGVAGLFGVTCGVLVLLIHLASLNSFGVPYLTPFAPTRPEGLKDTAVRWPLWAPKRRAPLAPGAVPAGGTPAADMTHEWDDSW